MPAPLPSRPAVRRRRGPAVPALLVMASSAALLAGCGDTDLVARVAELEQSQQQLRETVQDMAGSDGTAEQVGALATEVEALVVQLDEAEAAMGELRQRLTTTRDNLRGRVDDAQQAADAAAGTADAAATRAQQVEDALAGVRSSANDAVDGVSSLSAQLEAHRQDPDGHG